MRIHPAGAKLFQANVPKNGHIYMENIIYDNL